MFEKLISWFDRIWDAMGRNTVGVTLGAIALGVILLIASKLVGVDSVRFVGSVLGAKVIIPDNLTINKEVGFAIAPNWGIAVIALIPLIVFFLCRAKGLLKSSFSELCRRKMIVTIDGVAVPVEQVLEEWQRYARKWALVFPAVGSLVFVVILMDFIPVVGLWLIDETAARDIVQGPVVTAAVVADGVVTTSEVRAPLQLNHSTYEFDWSVAAVFDNTNVNAMANLVFSIAVYLYVPIIAASFMIASLIWFLSVPSFLARDQLESLGWKLRADGETSDVRRGFQAFSDFHLNVLLAATFIALLALGMHLQNVFLRAPAFDELYQMVFKDVIDPLRKEISLQAVADTISSLMTLGDAVDLDTVDGRNMQYIINLLGLFVLSMIVTLFFSRYLCSIAKRASLAYRAELPKGGENKNTRRRLREIQPWPAQQIPLWMFGAYLMLVIAAMYYVNLLGAILLAMIIKLLQEGLFSALQMRNDNEDDYDD